MKSNRWKWSQEHPLLAFYLLACGFSWAVEILLAFAVRGLIQATIPFSMHYLAGYGPMLAAIIMTGGWRGKAGLKSLFKRSTKWQVKPIWWLFAISPIALYLLAGLLQSGMTYYRLYHPGITDLPNMIGWVLMGTWSALLNLGWVEFLPGLGLAAFPLWLLTFGLGEEIGWRGYALPRLQAGRSPLAASIILWALWAFWHLPLFFYSYSLSMIPGFLIGLLAGTITLTWLYNGSGDSVLMAAVWHSAFNFVTACIECKSGFSAAMMSMAVIIWAVLLVIHYLRLNPQGVGGHALQPRH